MAKKNWNTIANTFINAWTQYFQAKGVKKEDIIVDDIYNLSGGGNMTNLQAGNKRFDLSDLDNSEARPAVETILNAYDESIGEKEELINDARDLFNSDVVQTILDVIQDDGFNSFKEEDVDFKIEYELDPDDLERLGDSFVADVQTKIDTMVEKTGLKSYVIDFLPELLRDGEHALAMKPDAQKGIVALRDDIDVINMLPFYKGNKLAFILEKTQEGSTFYKQERIRLYTPENIVFFRLKYFSKKSIRLDRIKLTQEAKDAFKEATGLSFPKYVRVCRPIYDSALRLIRQLKTMENVNLAYELFNLLKADLVGIGVPAQTSAEEAKAMIREYERHLSTLNQQYGSMLDMDATQLVELAKEKKLIPLWGDGKGAITPIDIGTQNKTQDSRDSISFLRTLIALAVGIPPYCLSLTDQGQDKQTTMRIYSRYTKKLTSIQKCLADGVQEVVFRHLSILGVHVEKKNIKVRFRPLTNGDILDDIDMMVSAITALGEMFDVAEKIANSATTDLNIDSEKLKEAWDTYTASFMNITGLLYRDKDKFDQDDEENREFGEPTGGSGGRRPVEPVGGGSNDLGGDIPDTDMSQPQDTAIDNANDSAYSDFAGEEL